VEGYAESRILGINAMIRLIKNNMEHKLFPWDKKTLWALNRIAGLVLPETPCVSDELRLINLKHVGVCRCNLNCN
jgi:hypothetical protein